MDCGCLGCKDRFKMWVKYPGFMNPTINSYTCRKCGTEQLFKFMRPPHGMKAEDGSDLPEWTVTMGGKIIRANPYVIDMIKEEKTWDAQVEREMNNRI